MLHLCFRTIYCYSFVSSQPVASFMSDRPLFWKFNPLEVKLHD